MIHVNLVLDQMTVVANKAYFPMLRVLKKINFDTTTSLKLFWFIDKTNSDL